MQKILLALRLLLVFALFDIGVAHAAPEATPAAAPPAVTAPTADAPYTGVWVDDSATLSDDTLRQMVEAVASQQTDPQHIVVLVHGLATPRDISAKQYAVLSKDVLAQYQKLGQRTAVVGLQWNSDLGDKKWIKKVARATIGGSDDNPYLRKVALARNVGATAGRQLFIKLAERFPTAHIDVLAHSLGCDVTRNIFGFDVKATPIKVKDAPEPTAPFAPEVPVKIELVALAGADIDYDLLYKDNTQLKRQGAAQLIWITIGGVRNPDAQDMVLTARGFVRGRAMGNTLPHMHRKQIDMLCSTRRVVFDANNIPSKHAFLQYYDPTRLARITSAAVALGDPAHHDALLDTLSEVLNAPADPKTLVKFFDRRDMAVSYYTLWRLENILCGHPRHLEDGYLQRVALLLTDDPRAIARERLIGPCLVVRQGWFPTPRQLDEALSKQAGVDGRPQYGSP